MPIGIVESASYIDDQKQLKDVLVQNVAGGANLACKVCEDVATGRHYGAVRRTIHTSTI